MGARPNAFTRAVRRAGELLKQIEPAKGGDRRSDQWEADRPLVRSDAARDAGMSAHQQKQATRVASIPEADFERQVESDAPPTVTALAQQGALGRLKIHFGPHRSIKGLSRHPLARARVVVRKVAASQMPRSGT